MRLEVVLRQLLRGNKPIMRASRVENAPEIVVEHDNARCSIQDDGPVLLQHIHDLAPEPRCIWAIGSRQHSGQERLVECRSGYGLRGVVHAAAEIMAKRE
jgi:hypothetical protein